MSTDELKQYVDWDGLKYYDKRVKEYIDSKCNSSEDQDNFRKDLEQLEDRIQTLSDSFTIDKAHIYAHIEACKNNSATKDELARELALVREEIKVLTGVDLSDYATIDFVESKLQDIEFPDNLVTRDELASYATKEDLAEEIGKINHPSIDLSDLVTKDELDDVKSMIPSVDGLASEEYVNQKFSEISIPEIPTKVSELDNDVGYLTEHQSLEGLATEEFVQEQINQIQLPDLDNYAKVTDIPDVSRFITEIPSVYVTESELDEKGFLTEHQSLEGLATKEFVTDKISEIPSVDLTGYAKVEDIPDTRNFLTQIPDEYVTDSELDDAVAEAVASQVDSLIDEKLEDILNEGVTVSSIAYSEF